uniref:Sigma 1s viral dissemination protein n=1 Tax=Mammalian orthoreovirus TaxID=351073 RepID=A0A8A1FW04_9REOV|nr:sigma 1s viral dissemination protein [Mammalian orthoreovirus]
MAERKKSKKSRNRYNNCVMTSMGSITNCLRSRENSLALLREYQPLSQDLVHLAIELLTMSGLSHNCQETWAQSIVVYPHWVTESMLQNKELASWLLERTISLAEHQLWKQRAPH